LPVGLIVGSLAPSAFEDKTPPPVVDWTKRFTGKESSVVAAAQIAASPLIARRRRLIDDRQVAWAKHKYSRPLGNAHLALHS
jgi:hypothetical protein